MAKPLAQQIASDSDDLATPIAPPTPAELFQQLWQKLGFVEDPQVLKDFQQLSMQAEQQDTGQTALETKKAVENHTINMAPPDAV